MPDELIAAIASDLGISELPREEQQKLIAQFGEIALKAASVAVLDSLTGEKKEQFLKLAEANDAAGVQEFLNRELPNHEEIARAAVAREVADFKAAQAA